MELAQVLQQHRVIVVLGSGGVGKTTTSAALALRAAMQGRRVLCLTIDPARRLANSLGLRELDYDEQRIDDELFAEHGLTCTGSLSAMMLDMKRTFDELVERHASSKEQRDRILENRLYQYVSTSLAGTQEYMAMEKLHAVRHDERFDLVVLDTPPTTNALDFLDAPQKLVGAIDSPVMRWFIEQLEEKSGLSLFSRGTAYVLRGLSRFTGVEFLEHVGRFVSDINELFGGFRDRAQAVYEDLRGDDVAFLIITSPSPIAVGEAVHFSRKLDGYGIEPRAVVVNRVHHFETPASDLDTASLSGVAPDTETAERLAQAMRQAAHDAQAMAARDSEGVRRLREHLAAQAEKREGPAPSYVEVPAFDRDVHDLGALSAVGEALLSQG